MSEPDFFAFSIFVLFLSICVPLAIERTCIRPLRRRFPPSLASAPLKPGSGGNGGNSAGSGSGGTIASFCVADALTLVGSSAPIIGMMGSLLFTIRFNFHSTVRVEGALCNPHGIPTPQLVPSISATIGGHAPQRYIWRICIAMMVTVRIFEGFVQYGHYRAVASANGHGDKLDALNGTVLATHTLQQFCLALLSYVSSDDYFPAHEAGFVGFAVFNVLHMISTMLLLRRCHGAALHKAPRVSFAWRWRKLCMGVNFALIAVMPYLYLRHERWCEPYLYSLFCVCEWLFVASNIAFLCAIYVDAVNWRLTVTDQTNELAGKAF